MQDGNATMAIQSRKAAQNRAKHQKHGWAMQKALAGKGAMQTQLNAASTHSASAMDA